jgi:hypothetical protein
MPAVLTGRLTSTKDGIKGTISNDIDERCRAKRKINEAKDVMF